MTRTTVADTWPEDIVNHKVRTLINQFSDAYDGWLDTLKLHPNMRGDVEVRHMTYQKSFVLGTLFSRSYTGRVEDAIDRLQYSYDNIKEYCDQLGAPDLNFQLQVIYQGEYRISGFDLLTHFTERTPVSAIASLLFFQFQYLLSSDDDDGSVAMYYCPSTVPEFMFIAYEDLPHEKPNESDQDNTRP